jgi:hypothetical protein
MSDTGFSIKIHKYLLVLNKFSIQTDLLKKDEE